MERYSVPLRIQFECGEIRTRVTPYANTLGGASYFQTTLMSSLAAPQASRIRRSLDVIESQTCVRFQRFQLGRTPRDYINVTKGAGYVT